MGREAKIAVAEEVPRKPAIAQKLRSQSESFGYRGQRVCVSGTSHLDMEVFSTVGVDWCG